MRHGLSTSLSAAAFLLPIAIAEAAPADPSGLWLTEDKRARVRVEKCLSPPDRLCGYVVWLRTNADTAVDRHNPDPRKQKRAIVGHQLMLGLKANEEGQYEGLIYNAEDGKTYDVTVWLAGPGDLRVKGCLVGFLCSTQRWTKATDTLPGQLAGPTGQAGGPLPDPEWAARTGSAPRRDAKPRS